MCLHLGAVSWLPYERWAEVAEPWARACRPRGDRRLVGALIGMGLALGGGRFG